MKKVRMFVLASAGSSLLSVACAAAFTESFASDPSQSGWKVFGDTTLFHWDNTNQNLQVTWDSAAPNSYFYLPLGTILNRQDDFELSFDLYLDDIGPANDYLWSFQLAVGFLNVDQARQPGFLRGTGYDSPNVVEFAYFRADDFGNPATVYPTFIGTNSQFNYNPGEQNSTNYTLAPGDWHHVTMTYTASDQSVWLAVTNDAGTSSASLSQPLNETFSDYQVTAVSISSYNHAGQFPGFEGSLLAHGRIDNLAFAVPPPPVQGLAGAFTNGVWQVQFVSRTNWVYVLEGSADFNGWSARAPAVHGTGTVLTLQDATASDEHGFYRVTAQRP